MNLYLISQDVSNDYDTYDAAVVAAESEEEARKIHPSRFVTHVSNNKWMCTSAVEQNNEYERNRDDWVDYADINLITVEHLGETQRKKGVVLASYNAG